MIALKLTPNRPIVHITKLVLTCLLLTLLDACASSPTQPVTVVVGNDAIQVLGLSVKTADELKKILAEKKISRIDLRTEPDTHYETIGRVIYGVTRDNIKIETLNGMVPK